MIYQKIFQISQTDLLWEKLIIKEYFVNLESIFGYVPNIMTTGNWGTACVKKEKDIKL